MIYERSTRLQRTSLRVPKPDPHTTPTKGLLPISFEHFSTTDLHLSQESYSKSPIKYRFIQSRYSRFPFVYKNYEIPRFFKNSRFRTHFQYHKNITFVYHPILPLHQGKKINTTYSTYDSEVPNFSLNPHSIE